jgi:hypothetical protein
MRMKQRRSIAEFWSPLFAQMQVTYLTFIFLTLQTHTKLKTTFGRNLLYCINSPLKDETRSGYFSKVIYSSHTIPDTESWPTFFRHF